MSVGDRSSAPVSLPPVEDPSADRKRQDSWDDFDSQSHVIERKQSGSTRAPFMPAPGVLIASKYRLVRPIGEGGMGAVWAAEHIALGHEVAVKFLRAEALHDRVVAARFEAEARMAAGIDHRCVVDVFDYGIAHGVPFMVLELLGGEELGARLQSGPALAVKDTVRLMVQCLNGLETVHRAGIVHRDLKPENIFLVHEQDTMFPKLLDFGIACLNEAEAVVRKDGSGVRRRRLTQAGVALGTPSYMAPEQLRAERNLDGRADLYSMGVILFELLTGRVPFTSENVADLLVSIMTCEPPRLYELRPELGRELSDVLARAMAREREQRYANAGELRTALERLLPNLPHAFSVVQDGTTPPHISTHTASLLAAAQNPFGEEDLAAFSQKRRKRLWFGVLALTSCAAVFAGLATRNASHQRQPLHAANASIETAVPVAPKAEPAVAMATSEAAAPGANAISAGAAKAVPRSASVTPKAEAGASKAAKKRGSHRTKPTEKPLLAKPAKKLFRNLDF